MDDMSRFRAFYERQEVEYVPAYYSFIDRYSAKYLYGENPQEEISRVRGPDRLELRIRPAIGGLVGSINEVRNGIRYETYITGTKVMHRGEDGSQSYFRQYTYFPIQRESDLDTIEPPNIEEVPMIKALAARVRAAKEENIPVGAGVLGPFDSPYYYLRRFEDYMMDYCLRPEFVRRMIAFCAEFIILEVVDRALEAGVNVIFVAEDLGGERQPFISPKMYREFIVDWLSEICCRAHRAGAYVHMHCDGNIMPLIDDIVAAGVDAIDPVAPGDTDLETLKQKYGHKLSFRGGISRHIGNMTPEELLTHWQDRLRIAAPGGGYYIGPSGGISWNTRREVADLLIKMATTREYVRL